MLSTLKSKSSTQYLGVQHMCAIGLVAKHKKPASATQKKIVALSTSCRRTDYCQVQGWTVNEIIDFCCYCALTLTVGPRRGESCAWPCYWPFFVVPLQSSASPWHQAQAASAQQFCKLGISCFVLCYICWIEVIKADAYPCIDMLKGRGEMLDLCCLNMMIAKQE